ncbi:MAG TPA: membrane-bound O-acyltransferase family protein [Candidatus Magasanikbacteria bacterium]|nr:membrane-bound O-acyltransferase family protein [Candidatus Magasanikbacteria bacterium]
MLFNSLQFFIFFPIVAAIYFLLPHKYRWAFLLVASSYFYMAFVPKYILVLAFLIIVDYCAGIGIERTSGARKKYILYISIISNIGMLFVFKYFNFFNQNISLLADWLNWNYPIEYLKIALPLGLSFHTFQSLSYIIEVYKGKYKAERHFGIYALYVMFFPQLVAGPIERPQHLLPQFRIEQHTDPGRFVSGLRQMLLGFFKKIVIADNLAPIVATAYANPGGFDGISLALATLAFVFQIYGDFSGYSDIAIGSARILGINLIPNFNKPFLARSIAEFWGRWHISLTHWFQDYVFTPLYIKISRVKMLAKLSHTRRHAFSFSLATVIGLALLGLWHGANWTFVIFGLTQALGILLYYAIRPFWDKLYTPLQYMLTVGVFFVGSIFFRAENVDAAFTIVSRLGTGIFSTISALPNLIPLKNAFSSIGLSPVLLFWLCVAVVFMLFIESRGDGVSLDEYIKQKPKMVRFAYYYTLMFAILLGGYAGSQPFIYFQF